MIKSSHCEGIKKGGKFNFNWILVTNIIYTKLTIQELQAEIQARDEHIAIKNRETATQIQQLQHEKEVNVRNAVTVNIRHRLVVHPNVGTACRFQTQRAGTERAAAV